MKRLGVMIAVAGVVAMFCVCAGVVCAEDAPTVGAPSEAVTALSKGTTAGQGAGPATAASETTGTAGEVAESTVPENLPPIRLLGPDGQRLTTGSVWVSLWCEGCGIELAAAIPMTEGEFRPTMRQIRDAMGEITSSILIKPDEMPSFRVFAISPGLVGQVVTGWTPTSGPLEISLRSAKRVELRLETADGQPLTTTATVYAGNPDHLIFVPGKSSGYFPRKVLKRFNEAREEAPGVYTFDADPDSTVAVYVDAPGQIRSWSIPALSSDEVRGGKITLRLPRPARLQVCLEPETPITGRKPFHRLSVEVSASSPGVLQWFDVHSWLDLETQETREPTLRHEFTDLAPGEYLVAFRAQHPYGWLTEGRTVSVKMHRLVLAPGDNPPVSAQYWLKNPARYRGDFAATVKVLRADGSPASGAKYALTVSDALYGDLEVSRGTVPDSGELRFDGLCGTTEIVSTTAPQAQRIRPYDLLVSGTQVGTIRMYSYDRQRELLEPLPDRATEKTFEFRLPPVVGDMAPDVEFASVTEEGRMLRLSELKGQVVFIDFWATWCGPCQGPMGALNDLAREKAAEWEGKVTLLGASVDDDRESVLQHIKRKQWTDVKQYWCGEEGPQNPATVYGVEGVPTCFLIGRDGRILWTGHPAMIDKHKKIEEALARP
ncbi:MAG: TlpA family protein disulfide reductase [Candidatus Sumerlaeaceae bacterium]|nr:TlpA family protein disulfide reductase [Candidatus Sumerlaeaceae bacterium]